MMGIAVVLIKILFVIGNAGFTLKIKQWRVNFAYRNVNFKHYGKLPFNLLGNIHSNGFQQGLGYIHPVFYQFVQYCVIDGILQIGDDLSRFGKIHI